MGAGDANNEPHSGDHLPPPLLRLSKKRTCHPRASVRAQSWGMEQMQRGKTCSARTGKTETRAHHSHTCLGPQDVQMPHLPPPRGSGCTGANPSLRRIGKNLAHCTGQPHRRALGTSPSWGVRDAPREEPQGPVVPGLWGAMGLTHYGSRHPPDPHGPKGSCTSATLARGRQGLQAPVWG